MAQIVNIIFKPACGVWHLIIVNLTVSMLINHLFEGKPAVLVVVSLAHLHPNIIFWILQLSSGHLLFPPEISLLC